MSFARIAVENLFNATVLFARGLLSRALDAVLLNAIDPQPSTRRGATTLPRRFSPTVADSTILRQTGCYPAPPPPKKFSPGLHDEKYSRPGEYEIPRSRSTRDCHPHAQDIFLRLATHRVSTFPRSCKCRSIFPGEGLECISAPTP